MPEIVCPESARDKMAEMDMSSGRMALRATPAGLGSQE